MYYANTMSASFELEKNRKAFLYTALIIAVLLLIAIFFKWQLPQNPTKIAEDLIEINLGNFDEGMGAIQPLIIGDKAPDNTPAEDNTAAASNDEPAKEQPVEDNNDEDAAPITKPEKVIKTTTVAKNPTTAPTKVNTTPAVTPAPKPRTPKIPGYQGNPGGTGNGATEDNGYKYQGNKPGGKGDAGDPSGNPDSYGKDKGGNVAGGSLRVSKGDRRIVNNYIFMGDLPKATINAVIKVTPEGRGTFVTFDKGSTSNDQRYANAIRSYLPNIIFDKADHESVVTVPFNFKVQ
jgi:outer membrane biosynthesis protein TonB